MAKTDKAMALFYDWLDAFEQIPADDFKALICAMMRFAKDGTEPPEFSGLAQMAALFIFPMLKRSRENAAAGKKGMEVRYNGEQTFESSDPPDSDGGEKRAYYSGNYRRGVRGGRKKDEREIGFDLDEFLTLAISKGEQQVGE